MAGCELLEHCGFFKKYKGSKNLMCAGFVKKFCHGEKMDECKRKQYRMQHGKPPEDDMMPSGHIMPKGSQ